jgi:hypothetical protein
MSDLEKELQIKKEVIEMQIEVLDEYRKELLRLERKIEQKEQVISNLKSLINEQNRVVHRPTPKN